MRGARRFARKEIARQQRDEYEALEEAIPDAMSVGHGRGSSVRSGNS